MKWHPASMMLAVWGVCFALFFILPFRLVGRELSAFGLGMLGASILAFCIGAWLRSLALPQQRPARLALPDFTRTDQVLRIASLVGILVLLYEWRTSGGDLSDAWNIRSERTTSLLYGTESGSSLAFQLGFLFSPVGYAVIAREIVFRPVVRPLRVAVLGFGPLIASSLALGGRAPLLWGFTMVALSVLTKRWTIAPPALQSRQRSPRSVLLTILGGVGALIALNYFVQVFVVRAEAVGGIETMFDSVATMWGVTFEGPFAEVLKTTLGTGNTYLIFVFAWYITQGIVISNALFTYYDGPPMYGIYGIELVSAAARRLNGAYVGARNLELNDLNVFGFLPSAFGTLYVDYWYFCLIVSAIWGYIAAIVYARVRLLTDARWLLAAPFVMQGIITSVINTPLGATNGLVSLSWMILAFVLAKPGVSATEGQAIGAFIPGRR